MTTKRLRCWRCGANVPATAPGIFGRATKWGRECANVRACEARRMADWRARTARLEARSGGAR